MYYSIANALSIVSLQIYGDYYPFCWLLFASSWRWGKKEFTIGQS